jgi:predicted CXXCH cytochrome family protein
MKKLVKIIILSIFFLNCDNDSEFDLKTPTPETVKYTTNIKPIMQEKCNSCHNSGNSNYSTYQLTKDNINIILNRIQRENGDNLLMPQGRPKLSQADINLFIKWKADGLLDNN